MKRRKGRNGSSSLAFSGDTTAYSPTSLCIRSQQWKQLHSWELHAAPATQCMAFCNRLGDVSIMGDVSIRRGKKSSSATQQLLAGASLSPPNSSKCRCRSDQQKLPQDRKEWREWKKMGWCLKIIIKKSQGFLSILFNSRKTPKAVMQLFHITAKQQEHKTATLSFGNEELPVAQPMAITLSFPYSSFWDYDMCSGSLFTGTPLCYK